jgi:hypothetical protein
MLKFYAHAFVKAQSYLQQIQNFAPMYIGRDQQWINDTSMALRNLKEECRNIHFDSVVAQIERAEQQVDISQLIETTGEGTISAMRTMVNPLLNDIGEAIKHELSSHVFLHISNERKQWYSEEDRKLFGEEVHEYSPRSTYHIAEAGRCFALERWDACVHHLMIATEEALRKWAKTLRLKTKAPIELSDWKPIIDAAKAKRDQLKNKQKSKANDKTIQRLSEQLGQFDFIKDAYRNYTAHGREAYDERKAKNIMNYVEAFMMLLAVKPSKKVKLVGGLLAPGRSLPAVLTTKLL